MMIIFLFRIVIFDKFINLNKTFLVSSIVQRLFTPFEGRKFLCKVRTHL